MTEEKDIKPWTYKTKLMRVTKEQHKALMKMANVYKFVKGWYVKELLNQFKVREYTVFTPWAEINKELNPRKMSTYLTVAKKEHPEELAWITSVSAHVAASVFENVTTCWKEKFKKGLYGAMKFAEEHGTNYYCKKGSSKEYALNDFYHIKGFPNFPKESRVVSFGARDLKIENGYLIIPNGNGNKKAGVEKGEPVKLKFWEKDTPFDETFFNSHNSQITFKFDGIDWWVSLLILPKYLPKRYDIPQTVDEKCSLGIDLGIKKAITCSNGMTIVNPLDDPLLNKYLAEEKKLQKLMSKNMQKMKDRPDGTYKSSSGKTKVKKSNRYKNYKRQHDRIMVKIERRKKHIWETLSAQFPWNDISRVVVEDLETASWFKNKKWASKLQKTSVSSFLTFIVNQAKKRNIEVVKADRNYPSTQLCSKCGFKEVSMKGRLDKRTFVCSECGHTLDRDLNAAINLANYGKTLDK